MSLFNKELQPVTVEQRKLLWSGSPNALRFRCKLCGHRFKVGDLMRFVWANVQDSPTRTGNFMVCEPCNDTDAVLLPRMAELEREAFTKFWWMVEDDDQLARWDKDA